jgi:peptide/nickel transport system permease protein
MMSMAYLIVDVVVIEAVFNYPGMGKLMVDAVAYRDIPIVQACGVLFSTIFVALNFLADLLAMLINPRQRLPRKGN